MGVLQFKGGFTSYISPSCNFLTMKKEHALLKIEYHPLNICEEFHEIQLRLRRLQCITKLRNLKKYAWKKIIERHWQMLDLIRIILLTKFHAYMMNIGWIITKKTIYDNIQTSFKAKITKISLKLVFCYWNHDGFHSVTYSKHIKPC